MEQQMEEKIEGDRLKSSVKDTERRLEWVDEGGVKKGLQTVSRLRFRTHHETSSQGSETLPVTLLRSAAL